jgi:hypothetical protein
MRRHPTLVVTSIAEPVPALQTLAAGCRQNGLDFILIGDEASPPNFALDGCRFFGLKEQRELGLRFADACPTRHYARKNIGYLIAIRDQAPVIVETDDDSVPYDGFWTERTGLKTVRVVEQPGWINVYRYFSDDHIWPRGLPLDELHSSIPQATSLPVREVACPIQQGLVDNDPDVDAVYRLVLPLPFRFEQRESVALSGGAWCPFNSQNTTWLPDAYPLLYLPSYCSFRMTDIWRSFVAQRIARANSWAILFHAPTIQQERNAHDLMRDFADEVPGYLYNRAIQTALDDLDVRPGGEHIPDGMRAAYELIVGKGLLKKEELDLLDAWLDDLARVSA